MNIFKSINIKKLVAIAAFIIVPLVGFSQLTGDTVRNELPQLTKPKEVLAKYLNFDVLKVMGGHGFGTGSTIDNGIGFSLRGQVLWPYAISKKFLKIAWGITLGYNKLAARSAEFQFADNKLAGIVKNENVKNTMFRTGYIGFTVLRVTRLKGEFHFCTIYTGASVEYNGLGRKFKIRTDDGKEVFSAKKYVNDISVPLHLQVSFSRKQFAAVGLFGSYDIKPRFKGNEFKKVRQAAAGLSLSLII